MLVSGETLGRRLIFWIGLNSRKASSLSITLERPCADLMLCFLFCGPRVDFLDQPEFLSET